MNIKLDYPILYNVKNTRDKLVFIGIIDNGVLKADIILGENKDSYMQFVDEKMHFYFKIYFKLLITAVIF